MNTFKNLDPRSVLLLIRRVLGMNSGTVNTVVTVACVRHP